MITHGLRGHSATSQVRTDPAGPHAVRADGCLPRSANKVADHLGVSRATIYVDLTIRCFHPPTGRKRGPEGPKE
jgi:hypothetical protein